MDVTQRKKKPIKGFILLGISLLMAGLAVVLSNNYIKSQVDYYKNKFEQKEELVRVVVPKENMRRGDVVTGNAFAIREIPKNYADSNSVSESSFSIAQGQKLNFDLDKGRALLWAHLDGGLAPTFSGKIENGLRALTIRVDEINSISGFLQPEDNVDLLLTYADKSKGKLTHPVMQNLHVLATGVKTVVDKTGRTDGTRYNTITVQVTPEDAMRITLAQDVGKMTAVLRNPEDLNPLEKDSVTVADVMHKKQSTVTKKPVKREKGIDIIIGGV